jgi:hypothetical protein
MISISSRVQWGFDVQWQAQMMEEKGDLGVLWQV